MSVSDVFKDKIRGYEKKCWGYTTDQPENIRELNTRLNHWECVTRQEYLFSYPPYLIIPSGDKCNLKCIFCTPREKDSTYKYDTVTYDQFKKFAYLMPFAKDIQVQGFGEPLINPDYDKIFGYVVKKNSGAHINFNTNGTLLNKKWYNLFSKCSDLHINVSLNASNRENYSAIMSGDYFDVVCKNISELIDLGNVYVSTSFIAMQQTIEDLPSYIELVNDLGVRCVILRDLIIMREEREQDSLAHHKDLTIPPLKEAITLAKKYGIELDTSSFPLDFFIRTKTEIIKPYIGVTAPSYIIPKMCNCDDPWTNMFIGSTGEIAVCCDTYAPHFGNIYDLGYDKIWNGQSLRHFRKTINTAVPPDGCQHCIKKLQSYG